MTASPDHLMLSGPTPHRKLPRTPPPSTDKTGHPHPPPLHFISHNPETLFVELTPINQEQAPLTFSTLISTNQSFQDGPRFSSANTQQTHRQDLNFTGKTSYSLRCQIPSRSFCLPPPRARICLTAAHHRSRSPTRGNLYLLSRHPFDGGVFGGEPLGYCKVHVRMYSGFISVPASDVCSRHGNVYTAARFMCKSARGRVS